MRLGARLGGMGKISELLLNIVIMLPTQGAERVDMRESYAAVPSAYMARVPSGEKAGPNPLLSSMWNRVSLYSCCKQHAAKPTARMVSPEVVYEK